MKKIIFLAVSVILCAHTNAFCIDENARNELASNSSMCAAYYMVVEECLKDERHVDTKKKFSELCDEMLIASIFFSNEKTAQSRLNLFKKQIYEEVENSCGNISRVVEKYGNDCINLSREFRKNGG